MNVRIKQYILYALLLLGGWFVLSNHFIYYQKSVKLLKKTELSLWYTFYSLDNKKPETVLKIDILREDGIGQIMVDFGLITEDERYAIEERFASEY